MCENEQKPELEPEPWKKELQSQSHTHENQELQSQSHVYGKKSSGAGAVLFLRQFHSLRLDTVILFWNVCEKSKDFWNSLINSYKIRLCGQDFKGGEM